MTPGLELVAKPWPDHRAERTLGAVSLLVGVCVIAMVVFVGDPRLADLRAQRSSLAGAGRELKREFANMQAAGVNPPASAFHLRAWPLVYGTLLTTAIAVVLGW